MHRRTHARARARGRPHTCTRVRTHSRMLTVVRMGWYVEACFCKYMPGCGYPGLRGEDITHFTQMISSRVKRIGCAYNDKGTKAVCWYANFANVGDQTPYVGKRTKTRAECTPTAAPIPAGGTGVPSPVPTKFPSLMPTTKAAPKSCGLFNTAEWLNKYSAWKLSGLGSGAKEQYAKVGVFSQKCTTPAGCKHGFTSRGSGCRYVHNIGKYAPGWDAGTWKCPPWNCYNPMWPCICVAPQRLVTSAPLATGATYSPTDAKATVHPSLAPSPIQTPGLFRFVARNHFVQIGSIYFALEWEHFVQIGSMLSLFQIWEVFDMFSGWEHLVIFRIGSI